jgi:hypothetical protein
MHAMNGIFQPNVPQADFAFWARKQAWKETDVAGLK